MIKIFILTNGYELIGSVDDTELTYQEIYNITDPMYIIGGRSDDYNGGAMRLRDAMMLAEEDVLSIPHKFVVTHFRPSKTMIAYYTRAIEFSKQHTRPEIEEQIGSAIKGLDGALVEDEEQTARFSAIIAKLAGGSGNIH